MASFLTPQSILNRSAFTTHHLAHATPFLEKLQWLPIAHLVQPQSNCPTFFPTMGLAANHPRHTPGALVSLLTGLPLPAQTMLEARLPPQAASSPRSSLAASTYGFPPSASQRTPTPTTIFLNVYEGSCYFFECVLYLSPLRAFARAVTLPRTKHPQLPMKMPLSSRRAQLCPQSCLLLHRWVFLDPPIEKSPPGTLCSRT